MKDVLRGIYQTTLPTVTRPFDDYWKDQCGDIQTQTDAFKNLLSENYESPNVQGIDDEHRQLLQDKNNIREISNVQCKAEKRPGYREYFSPCYRGFSAH